MAEWVQKGNLKGPQGDPGQDAQLPAGGTNGQVLTKTADGEVWQDAPQPDMTGVVKYDGATFSTSDYGTTNSVLFMDEDAIDQISIEAIGNGADFVASSYASATIRVQDTDANHEVLFKATPSSANFSIDSKSVNSITDAIADSPAGSALVTDKAVKDYVDSHGGGGAAVCELTLSGDGTASAAFTYQGLDGTFSYEAPMDGSRHETVVTVPVGSVVKVSYGKEPGVRVSTSFADLISDSGTSTRPVNFYLVNSTSASIAVKGSSVVGPGVIV